MANTNLLSSLFILTFLLFSFLTSTHSSTISDYLIPHNKIRSQFQLKPLQWSSKLATYARSYGNKRRVDCKLIHSKSNYGENIFWGKGQRWRPSDAVAAWFAERSKYDYKKNSCNSRDCSHYTQMVWKTTSRVGCAKIICKSRNTFIICIYDPHGNVIGQKPF